MLPNFLIGGSPKTGSSTLHHCLSQHPDIFMSPVKEVGYFTAFHKKPLDWYEDHFSQWSGQKMVGEASVDYLAAAEAPGRIRDVLPGVKLVFSVRNPAERALSHYWHRVKYGQEDRSFDEVVETLSPEDYPLKFGLYYRGIERYLEFFNKENIKVVLMEDLSRNLMGEVIQLCRFLGVDDSLEIDEQGEVKNKAKTYRYKYLSRLLSKLGESTVLRNSIPSKARPLVSAVYMKMRKMNLKPFEYEALTDEHRSILNAFFEEDIRGLERFLERETGWLP